MSLDSTTLKTGSSVFTVLRQADSHCRKGQVGGHMTNGMHGGGASNGLELSLGDGLHISGSMPVDDVLADVSRKVEDSSRCQSTSTALGVHTGDYMPVNAKVH